MSLTDTVTSLDHEIARLQRFSELRPHDLHLPMQIARLQLRQLQATLWREMGFCQACGSRVFYADADTLKCAYCRPPNTSTVSWFVVST